MHSPCGRKLAGRCAGRGPLSATLDSAFAVLSRTVGRDGSAVSNAPENCQQFAVPAVQSGLAGSGSACTGHPGGEDATQEGRNPVRKGCLPPDFLGKRLIQAIEFPSPANRGLPKHPECVRGCAACFNIQGRRQLPRGVIGRTPALWPMRRGRHVRKHLAAGPRQSPCETHPGHGGMRRRSAQERSA